MTTVISEETRRANKNHTCDDCEKLIDAGTEYIRACCTDGRDIWTWKDHPTCLEAARAIYWDRLMYDEWPTPDEVREELERREKEERHAVV